MPKPVLEYVGAIRIQTDIPRSVKAFKRLLRYHRPYSYLFILIIALAALRSYLFTLEPLYTSQIIDEVIVEGKHDLLLNLVLSITIATVAFGVTNFVITYLNGYAAQLIIRDVRSDYYSSLQSKSFKFLTPPPLVTSLRELQWICRLWTCSSKHGLVF